MAVLKKAAVSKFQPGQAQGPTAGEFANLDCKLKSHRNEMIGDGAHVGERLYTHNLQDTTEATSRLGTQALKCSAEAHAGCSSSAAASR
jgi:hypothetical protein